MHQLMYQLLLILQYCEMHAIYNIHVHVNQCSAHTCIVVVLTGESHIHVDTR